MNKDYQKAVDNYLRLEQVRKWEPNQKNRDAAKAAAEQVQDELRKSHGTT